MNQTGGEAHLDVYLDQVRRLLRGFSPAEVAEILAELRSHVLDRVEGELTPAKVEAAIEALGSPRDIARANMAERAHAEMEADRSLLAVPRAVGRLATVSIYGFFAFLVSVTGYGLGAAFLLTALAKPFAPSRVGLWRSGGPDDLTFSMGMVEHAPHAQELLGWWIVPVGLVVGALALWLTWRFGVFSVRLMAGRSRRRSAPPSGRPLAV
jgi:hypothetical protein